MCMYFFFVSQQENQETTKNSVDPALFYHPVLQSQGHNFRVFFSVYALTGYVLSPVWEQSVASRLRLHLQLPDIIFSGFPCLCPGSCSAVMVDGARSALRCRVSRFVNDGVLMPSLACGGIELGSNQLCWPDELKKEPNRQHGCWWGPNPIFPMHLPRLNALPPQLYTDTYQNFLNSNLIFVLFFGFIPHRIVWTQHYSIILFTVFGPQFSCFFSIYLN